MPFRRMCCCEAPSSLTHYLSQLMFLSATASSILVIAALKSSSYAASVTKGGQKYVSAVIKIRNQLIDSFTQNLLFLSQLEDATISLFSVTLGGLLIGVGEFS